MKITNGRIWWKGAAAAALLLIGVVAVRDAPASATFRAKNGRIAFRRFLNEERTWGAVFTIRPDGTGERQITNPPEGFVDRNPDVSPDGRRIVFEREHVDCDLVCSDEIWVVDSDGSHLTRLTFNPPDKDCFVEGATCNGSPAWSPDGHQIAFRRQSGPVVKDLLDEAGIYVINDDGSNLRQITQHVHRRSARTLTRNGHPTGAASCSNEPTSAPPNRPTASPCGSSTCATAVNAS